VSATERQLEAVRTAVEPAIGALGCGLYDVELVGAGKARTLRITITRESGGVDLDTITDVTRAVSPIVDDTDTLNGPFLLEVSSPGIERTLRTPAHYRGAIGELVSVKFHTPAGPRRVRGTLVDADDERATVEAESGERDVIAYADVTQARTVFEWGPEPRSGSSGKAGRTRVRAKEGR
jgi:ribosome maturation factor RimP